MTQWFIVKSGFAVLVCQPGAQVKNPGKSKPLPDDPELCWVTDKSEIIWPMDVDWVVSIADIEKMVGAR